MTYHANDYDLGRRFRLAILVSVGLLFSQQCRSDEVQVPGAAAPTQIFSRNQLGPTFRHCIIDGLTLRATPEATGKPLGQLEYLEKVALADGYPEESSASPPYTLDVEHRAQNNDWALVCTPDASGLRIAARRGWVPRRFLVDGLWAEADPMTRIDKKAVVVNPRELVKANGGDLPPVRPLWTIPGETAASPAATKGSPELSLYRMLYVYAEVDDWLLVAARPNLETEETNTEAKRKAELLGWIPARRVARWNTRECLQWDRHTFESREEPGALFLSAQEATSKYGATLNPGDAFREPAPATDRNGKILELANSAMRFHLLADFQDARRRNLPDAKDWVRPRGVNQLFELGCVVSLDGRSVDLDSEQDRIDRLAQEVEDTEVLFVIDDTESMDIAILAVADLVPLLIKELELQKVDSGGDVYVTIVFYHDGKTSEEAVTVSRTFTKFKLSNINTADVIADFLRDKAKPENMHKDELISPLERVFDGIKVGIRQAEFEQHTRKLLFVLGDCGDRVGQGGENGLTSEAQSELNEIARNLLPRDGSPIEVHVLQMKDPELNDQRSKPAFKMFHGQLKTGLQQVYAKRLAERFEEFNNKPNPQDFCTYQFFRTPAWLTQTGEDRIRMKEDIERFVGQAVVEQLAEARKQGQKFWAILKALQSTGDLEAAAENAVQTGAAVEVVQAEMSLLQRMLEVEGLTDFLENYKNIQPYSQLYGWERSPKGTGDLTPQMRRMILVNYTELEAVLEILSDLERQFDSGRPIDFVGKGKELFEKQTGGMADYGSNLSEYEKAKTLFKALRFHSPVFSVFFKSTDGAIDQSQLTVLKKDLLDLFLKRRLIGDILNKIESGPEDFSLTGGKWERGSNKTPLTKDRSFPRHGTFYYYIDFEREWP